MTLAGTVAGLISLSSSCGVAKWLVRLADLRQVRDLILRQASRNNSLLS
jgi:hypothetical protein